LFIHQVAALVLVAVAACEAIGATSYANSNLLSLGHGHGGLGYGGIGGGYGGIGGGYGGIGGGYGAGLGGFGAGYGVAGGYAGAGAGYNGGYGHDHYVSVIKHVLRMFYF